MTGRNIDDPDFFPKIEVPKNLLGDILAVCELVSAVNKEFNSKKFKWVGTQLIRVPDAIIWEEILKPSFLAAKEIGYRGDFERWCEICKEYVNNETEN